MTTYTTAQAATTRCPRCNRPLSNRGNVIANHLSACRRVPPPAELAQVFRLETAANVPDLGRRYRVYADFIRRHLLSAGITAAAIRARGSLAQGVRTRRRLNGKIADVYKVCEVLLAHPAVPRGKGGKCGWCS